MLSARALKWRLAKKGGMDLRPTGTGAVGRVEEEEKFSLASPKEHKMDPAGAAWPGWERGWISIRECSSLEV